MRRLLLALAASLLLATHTLAAGTVVTALSSTAYTDLGAAPLQLQALGSAVGLVVSDSLPAVTALGMNLQASPNNIITVRPADAGSHVYGLSLSGGASIAATFVTP